MAVNVTGAGSRQEFLLSLNGSGDDEAAAPGPAAPGSLPWDHTDPIISFSMRILLQQVFKCYVRQAIVFVGIPGNCMCCLVFFKHGLSDRINLLLFWLAVADLGNLLCQLLFMPGCYLTDKIQTNNWGVLLNTKIMYGSWWLGHLSGLLVVNVSVNRCLSVALPLRAKRLLGYRSTVTAIVLCYLLSLLVFLPGMLAYSRDWRTDPATNRSMAYMIKTPWFPFDHRSAIKMIYVCFAVALPILLCVMIVCCTITILNLRQASRQRLKMTGNVTEESKAGQNRITVMLLVICAVFFVLAIPETAFAVVRLVVPGFSVYGKYHNTLIVIYQLFWITICLNSAANFFVYFALSSRFQTTLKIWFCAVKSRSRTGVEEVSGRQ